MSFLDDIQNIKPTNLADAMLLLLSTIAPGCLVIYHWQPTLFVECNVLKLILLSSALTLPLIIFNEMVAAIATPTVLSIKGIEFEGSLTECQNSIALLLTASITYYTFTMAYVLDESFRQWVLRVVRGEMITFWIAVIIFFVGIAARGWGRQRSHLNAHHERNLNSN